MIFQVERLSCHILLTDEISLSDYLYVLRYYGNMYIAIVCFPGCDAINFEINLVSLIKTFFYMVKKSRQKFKYLDNKKSF